MFIFHHRFLGICWMGQIIGRWVLKFSWKHLTLPILLEDGFWLYLKFVKSSNNFFSVSHFMCPKFHICRCYKINVKSLIYKVYFEARKNLYTYMRTYQRTGHFKLVRSRFVMYIQSEEKIKSNDQTTTVIYITYLFSN